MASPFYAQQARHPVAVYGGVGFGQKADGKDVGFVIEVVKGSGVVESTYIEPVGIASHHKKAAFMSKTNGKYLIDTLTEMAVLHRKNYPQ